MLEQDPHDHGIYSNDDYIPKPHNWEELLWMIRQPRNFPVDKVEYQAFEKLASEVFNKNEAMTRILPLIQGNYSVYTSGGHLFLNIENLTDNDISKASPDIYDGADPEDVDQRMLTELDTFIKPLKDKKTPVVPSFFFDFKDPDSELPANERQDFLAGSIGARAIQKVRSFEEDDPEIVYDKDAYTITVTYSMGGSLSLYAHAPIQSSSNPNGSPSLKYGTTLIKKYAMRDSLEEFRGGITAFRNAREWTMEKRDDFIALASERMENMADTLVMDSPGEESSDSLGSVQP